MKKQVLTILIWAGFVTSAFAQNVEVTGQVGGQLNGGVNLSTSLFQRIEVANGVNYGITAGYLLGEHYGIEFLWNQNKSATFAQPIGGFSSVKLFTLSQNQYMGNFVLHLTARDVKMRPFLLFGIGANALNPETHGVSGATRLVYSLGAGAKYNVSKHLGLRGQAKWSPTYITSSNAGYWCDPFWGGCWAVGNNHYLNEFDITGGITLRFGRASTTQ
jgi:Outer membrane protein beta-barrel domain